jgi:hypothetical protein
MEGMPARKRLKCGPTVTKDQVSNNQDQDQHQQEYVGTVENLQQLQQDFDSLTKRMVDGEGTSQQARETTKQSIETLLEQIAYVRDQVNHQNVKWETHDLQDVQYELSMTHRKLAQFKMSLLMLSRRVDGLAALKEQVKILTMSYCCIEDLAEERHSEYMLRFVKSEEPIVVNEQPVPVTVDVNQATVVAQIKIASD